MFPHGHIPRSTSHKPVKMLYVFPHSTTHINIFNWWVDQTMHHYNSTSLHSSYMRTAPHA
ncbi:hypothetical protein RchiOBHm_Chr2g0138491 [Rosa chinensis]|uniref:Uncharacterized protein n=1 Tax=Rosa chinensis TaxID=74649 RepID=A0A2P6RWW4_ROSCH|nr:hypothetical protein RchiOBHm_Chr2g0138491 [Rosa chinensis]